MTLLTKFYTSLSLLLFSELGSFANVSAKDYDIQVKTGDRAFAGTDANIYLTIYGNEGTTTERRLNGLISGDAFERNSLDALTLVGLEDVGTLEKVKVRSDGSWFAPDWYLDWVSVDGQKATFNRWIEDAGSATADFDATGTSPPNASPTESPSRSVSAKDYDIQVKTGDRAFAGTDANIYLTIYGNEGTTTERRLNGLISGDAFERKSLDALTLVGLEDVGTLEKVKVRSDGSRFAPDWYLDWVSVDGQKATFNRWIEDAGSATADFDPTPSCMSGETGVMSAKARHQIALRSSQRHGSTVLKVKDLKINDVIIGLDGNKEPASCTVEAVGNFGFGPVYGNYTDGHFVLNPETGVVEKHGSEQIMSIQDKYIVVTSCPLGVDEAGVGFTPFDSDFFGELTKEMTWKDYLLLHTAILRVVRETGSFWFHGSSYKDWTFLHQHATRMSKTMLKCMKDHNDCKDLEEASVVFIERALAEPAKKKAYEALHNIGQHRNLGSASAAVTGGRSVRK